MGRQRNVLERLSLAMDLAEEPLPGLPVVEVFGEHRVLIENHNGVMEYGRESIRVRVKYGQIRICGSCLELRKLSSELLIITGTIYGVELIRRC